MAVILAIDTSCDETSAAVVDGTGTPVWFALPAHQVTVHDTWDSPGLHGTQSCDYSIDDVFVPEDARLGEEGRGFKVVMEAFNKSRPIIGARGVGLAQGAKVVRPVAKGELLTLAAVEPDAGSAIFAARREQDEMVARAG